MSHLAGSGYRVELDCRWCGGNLYHLADGKAAGTDSRAIAKCRDCRTEWTIIVRMVDPSDGRRKLTEKKLESIAHARTMRTY